jgi:hypothetical protein
MTETIIEVEGFTPHTKQKEVVDLCLDENLKYIICTTGRQFGKTFLAMNILLKWALEDNGSVSMFVAPVYSQSKKVFSELVSAIAGSGLTLSVNKSELFISFINGSIIYFRSGEREDSLRGYTLDYLILDEAAYQREGVWKTVLRPTVLVKGKKVLFISTPKGKNWFYEIANRGYSNDFPQYTTYHATSFDTPFISKEELDEAKLSLPENIYKQEILAEFLEDGGEVFSNLNFICSLDQYRKFEVGQRYYAGLDFGRQNDYTVLTIINSNGELVDFYRGRQKSWEVIVSELLSHLQKYKPQVYCEVNSMGDVLYENLKKKYSMIEPFVTNQESKINLIEDMILAFNEAKILLPTPQLNPDLYRELSTFSYEYSPKTRKVRYSAPSGMHDDCVISLALANHAMKRKYHAGKYAVR